MNDYDKDDLAHDMYLMVKAGLLDINMRDDGEWVYSVTDKSRNMTEEEREYIITHLNDYEDVD